MAEHTLLGWHGVLIENVVIPHYRWFALLTMNVEWLAGTMLLLGFYARFGAVLGALQSLNLLIGLAAAPGHWPWAYVLMMTLHLMILVHPLPYLSLDTVVHAIDDAWRQRPARRQPRYATPSPLSIARLHTITSPQARVV